MNALATRAATSCAGGACEVHPSSEPRRVKNWRSSPVTARAPSDCSPIVGRGPGEALDCRGDQGAGIAVDERGERAEQAGHRPEGIDGRARRRRQPGGHQIAQALEPGEGGAEIGQVGELARQVAEAGDERAEGVGAVAAVGAGERLAGGARPP